MHEYEVGVNTEDGFQRHSFRANRYRIADGALMLQATTEGATEYTVIAIFTEWTYVIDRTMTRMINAAQ